MNSPISSLRRAAIGLLLLALLPACVTVEPPQATGTPQWVVTAEPGDPYPPPVTPVASLTPPYPPPPTRQALPTRTPTTTPGRAGAAGAAGIHGAGAVQRDEDLYVNAELGGFRVELDGTNEIVWDAMEPFTIGSRPRPGVSGWHASPLRSWEQWIRNLFHLGHKHGWERCPRSRRPRAD
jgi:hypothetical protein